MQADVELLIHPYCFEQDRSILHLLISELQTGSWTRFRAAVAFARTSGNYRELLEAMVAFSERGGSIDLTFGADTFAGETSGSEYEALEKLLATLNDRENVRLFLYHERGLTFHPKVFLFANEGDQRALVIVGSSNWSSGGFGRNVEVNAVIRLQLGDKDAARTYSELNGCFDTFWTEP